MENIKKEVGYAPGLIQEVRSDSDPTKVYELRMGKDGVFYCTCPAWKFQRLSPKHRECKHMRAYIAEHGKPVLATGVLSSGPVRKAEPVQVPVPVREVAKVEHKGQDLVKVAAYMRAQGQAPEAILKVLKEGGLTDLGAWALLANL